MLLLKESHLIAQRIDLLPENFLSHFWIGVAATRTSVVEPGVHLSQSDVAVHRQTIFFRFGRPLLHRIEVVQMIDRFVADPFSRLERKRGDDARMIVELTVPRAGEVVNSCCGGARRRLTGTV